MKTMTPLPEQAELPVLSTTDEQKRILGPATDVGRNVPRQIDETLGGFQHGGFQRFQNEKATRDSYALKSLGAARRNSGPAKELQRSLARAIPCQEHDFRMPENSL